MNDEEVTRSATTASGVMHPEDVNTIDDDNGRL